MTNTTYGNSFEGGTTGTVITTVNSGGVSGTAFTATASGTVYDNTVAAHGSMAMKIANPGTAGEILAWTLDGGESAVALRCYVYFDALPGADWWLMKAVSTVQNFMVEVTAAGNLALLSRTSSAVWTSANALSPGSWYRVDVWADVGTSTTTGQGKIAYYSMDSTTAIEASAVLTGKNFGGDAGNPTQANFGKCNATAITTTLRFDDVAAQTGATDFIGRVAAAAASTGTLTDNVALLKVAGSGGEPPYTYAISQTSGPDVTPTNVAEGQWIVPKDTSEDLDYQVVITDSTGAAAPTVSFSVPPIPSSGTLHYFDGTNVITV